MMGISLDMCLKIFFTTIWIGVCYSHHTSLPSSTLTFLFVLFSTHVFLKLQILSLTPVTIGALFVEDLSSQKGGYEVAYEQQKKSLT